MTALLASVAVRIPNTTRYLRREKWTEELEEEILSQLQDGITAGFVFSHRHGFTLEWFAECDVVGVDDACGIVD